LEKAESVNDCLLFSKKRLEEFKGLKIIEKYLKENLYFEKI